MKNENQQKVTIYTSSEFFGSFHKYVGKLIDFGTRKYAQYDNAPFVTFIPSKKRKARQILKSFQPMILILEGIGHPDPETIWGGSKKENDVTVTQSKYSSFDERWSSDFDSLIDKYIQESGVNVIADYRHTKGFNSYTKPQPPRQTHADWIAGLQAQGLDPEQVREMDKRASI